VTTETQVPVEGWNQVEGGTVQDNAKPKKGKAKADKVDKPAPVAAKGRATASKDAPVDVTALRARLDALKIEIATVRASLKAAGKGNGGTRERVSTIENPVAFIWSSLNSMAKKNKGEVARKDALATLLAAGCGKNTISTQLHRWKHATPAERTARASKA
jgi:outer membrane murein-binding lipoprotein Lpp